MINQARDSPVLLLYLEKLPEKNQSTLSQPAKNDPSLELSNEVESF